MNLIKKSILAISISMIATLSQAAEVKPSTDANVAKIEAKSATLFGDIGISKITKVKDVAEKAYPASAKIQSSMLDLYEVKMNNGARVYTDANANFWLLSRQGLDFIAATDDNEIVNINGIADRENTLSSISKLGKTIDFKAKDEKSSVTVFFDVNCGYCNKLFNERQQYLDKGITLKFAAAPIFDGSEQTMSKIWCSPDYADRLVAYEKYTNERRTDKNAKAPELGEPNAECLKTVQTQGEIARKIGLKGTPLLVLPNGDKIPGYNSASDLEALINKK